MRLLVACPECKRQFDASGREPGSRFHCSCGALLTVPRPRSHDAAVVRCSSCGAPREGDAETCPFCGSEFTLHERDLHTVCPQCMARISDHARHCHWCGTPITPQGSAGETTAESCPVCGAEQRLVSRNLGGPVTVLECGRCGGMWLGQQVFELLEKHARTEAGTLQRDPRAGHVAPVTGARQSGPMYRPCVVCGRFMNRRNYGKRSGVILDVCQDHGLWFDAGELEQALRWVRDGGLARAERIEEEKRQDQQRQERFRQLAEVPSSIGERKAHAAGRTWMVLDTVGGFVGDLISVMFDR